MSENTPKQPKSKLYLSLRWKMLIVFTLLFTAVFAGIYYWFYTFATDNAMNRIKEDMIGTLAGAAEGVDGDALVALTEEAEANADGFADDERYWQQVRWLQTVNHIEPRAFAYTYLPGTEGVQGEVRYVADFFAESDPESAAKFLETFVAEDDPKTDIDERLVMSQGFTQTTTYMEIYTDPWGSWVSGYTPITNSKGETVGALGIDFEASYVKEVQNEVKDGVLPAVAITYPILFLMVFVFSRILTRPVVMLTRSAERIGEGDYNQDLSSLTDTRLSDEITRLANVFEIMVGKVSQREQKLKQQVSDLQIMIDESRRQQQVEEIVDSDFFRDLQSKAKQMRDGFTSRGSRPLQAT